MKPRLHLFGHHHRFTEQERQGVRSIGLDLVSRSYLLIDGAHARVRTTIQMTRPSFTDALASRVLVCDGAMGTMLYAKGIFLNRSFDELNLTQPDLVAEVHQAYVTGRRRRDRDQHLRRQPRQAGAVRAGRSRQGDQRAGSEDRQAGGARAGVRRRRSIGPLGIRIEPWGKTGVDEAEAYFREQVDGLLEGGVELFVLETFHDVNEIAAAIRAVRGLSDLPIVAQVTTEEDGNTLDGAPPEAFVPQLEALGATVIGVNCSVGPAGMLETIERMARVAHVPLSAQPNAGRPREIEGRNIYLSSPEYMASYARRFVATACGWSAAAAAPRRSTSGTSSLAVRALIAAGPAPAATGRSADQRAPGGRPSPAAEPVAAIGEVAAGQRARARAVRGQRRADAAARPRRRPRSSSRRGSCAFTAWTSSTSPTVLAPARA